MGKYVINNIRIKSIIFHKNLSFSISPAVSGADKEGQLQEKVKFGDNLFWFGVLQNIMLDSILKSSFLSRHS